MVQCGVELSIADGLSCGISRVHFTGEGVDKMLKVRQNDVEFIAELSACHRDSF